MRNKILAALAAAVLTLVGAPVASAHAATAAEHGYSEVAKVAVSIASPVAVASGNGNAVTHYGEMAPTKRAYSSCPAGKSCLWTGEHGAGQIRHIGFSDYDPVGTCHTLTLVPVGGYHSAKGGFGSGYAMAIYSGGSCSGLLDVLWSGDTWSSAFTQVRSVMIT